MKITAQVQQDGRLQIPAPIRRKLDIDPGTLVEADIKPVEVETD